MSKAVRIVSGISMRAPGIVSHLRSGVIRSDSVCAIRSPVWWSQVQKSKTASVKCSTTPFCEDSWTHKSKSYI